MALPANYDLMLWYDRGKQATSGLPSSASIENRHSRAKKTELTYYDGLFSPSERCKNRYFAPGDKMFPGTQYVIQGKIVP
jgi:hypothetical protein